MAAWAVLTAMNAEDGEATSTSLCCSAVTIVDPKRLVIAVGLLGVATTLSHRKTWV